MSHGAATPPSYATRALHGAACMNGSRPAPGNANPRVSRRLEDLEAERQNRPSKHDERIVAPY
jgi:hypothetical protein